MNTSRSVSHAPDEQILLAHAYFDGELDPVNALLVGNDIARDKSLAAEIERVGVLRHAVQERLPIEPVSDRLRSRIEAAIGKAHEPSRPSWRALAASVVLAMVMASGLTWTSLTNRSDDRIAGAVIDGHLRSLMSQRPIDVASSETHTVKPWFNGRTTHAPTVIDLSKDGFPLLGGRVDVIESEPVPALVYTRRKHLISVFVLPRATAAQSTLSQSINGYNLVRWNAGNVEYWAASDLNSKELSLFAQLFQKASMSR